MARKKIRKDHTFESKISVKTTNKKLKTKHNFLEQKQNAIEQIIKISLYEQTIKYDSFYEIAYRYESGYRGKIVNHLTSTFSAKI